MQLAVLTTTYRPRGFERLLQALAQQTRKPDTLVLALEGVALTEALGTSLAVRNVATLVLVEHVDSVLEVAVARNWNIALDRLSGRALAPEQLVVLISDCSWVPPHFLERIEEIFSKVTLSMLGANTVDHKDVRCEGRVEPGRLHVCSAEPVYGSHQPGTLLSMMSPMNVGWSSAAALLTTWEAVGGWDERLCGGKAYDEGLLFRRVGAITGKPALIAPELVCHRFPRAAGSKKETRTPPENWEIVQRLISDPEEMKKQSWRQGMAPR